MGHEYADFTIYVVVCFLLLFLQQSLHCNAQQPSDLLEQRSAEYKYASRRFPGCVAGERLHGGVNPESKSLDSRRIVSIGDVHGSLIGLHELLWTAGIIAIRVLPHGIIFLITIYSDRAVCHFRNALDKAVHFFLQQVRPREC